jgi:hypothetical protein
MLEILRHGAPGSRGHPPDLHSGLHYTWTQVALAQSLTLGSATRRQPTSTGSPSGPVGSSDIDTILNQLRD